MPKLKKSLIVCVCVYIIFMPWSIDDGDDKGEEVWISAYCLRDAMNRKMYHNSVSKRKKGFYSKKLGNTTR
jgi:hypothetical protein